MNSKKLRDMRRVLGISQVRLAKMAGVGRWAISMYEAGFQDLGDQEMEKIRSAIEAAKAEVIQNVNK